MFVKQPYTAPLHIWNVFLWYVDAYLVAIVTRSNLCLDQIGPLPSKDRFQVLALSCILIAAKYNGPECEVPPMSEFWEFGNRCYSINEIHSMELSTLTK